MVNTMTLGMIAMLMATLVFPGHARFDGEEGLDRQYDKSTQHEAILANDDADRGERRSLRRGVLDADHSGGDKGILREGSSRKAREEARKISHQHDRGLTSSPQLEESFSSEPAVDFLQLAQQRFHGRKGRSATPEEEEWTFDTLQLVRVPKAASTEASIVARQLAGCTPHGPCCAFPGDPVGSCPARGLMCPKVVGCTGHKVGVRGRGMLENPGVFSMSNLRDPADRLVSGYFYTPPHSPPCAHDENEQYATCFKSMTETVEFQNVASRMIGGEYAYDKSAKVCLDKADDNGGSGREARIACEVELEDVIRGACHLNFVSMCEAWGSSLLLLFETVPWIGPSEMYFPHAKSQAVAESNADEGGARHNSGRRHREGIKEITPELLDAARRGSEVDESLHDFVTAKFCGRLRELGLIDHLLVKNEIEGNERLHLRCSDPVWVEKTLERFAPITPEDCRLYRPFTPSS